MDDHSRSGASNSSLKDLMMDEYSSRPPQISEWFWCIEYAAKFRKDIRSLLGLMEIGYNCSDDFGDRINEVIAFRLLELMFDPSNSNANEVGAASTSKPSMEFDFSSSNVAVLSAILKEVPVSELSIGTIDLTKFNVLPFIVHKRTCMPQYALEKMRDFSLTENIPRTTHVEENQSVHPDDIREELRDEQQVRNDLEQMPINEKDKVIIIDEEDGPISTNENYEVIVIDNEDDPIHTNNKDQIMVDDEKNENDPIHTNEKDQIMVKDWENENDESDENVRVKCTKDGTWLISGGDDESDMVNSLDQNDPALVENNADINRDLPSSSQSRPDNVCSKCKKEGTFLICNTSECASKIHRECLNSPPRFDDDGNFYCPFCWHRRHNKEYLEHQEKLIASRRKLAKFLKLLSAKNKRSILRKRAATTQ